VNWHALEAKEVMRVLETSFEGLSGAEAKKRLATYRYIDNYTVDRYGLIDGYR